MLLDGSASGPVDSEKTAPPNLSLRGFDVIEDLRRRVHKQCGAGSVSCSDITAIVARDAIVLVNPYYMHINFFKLVNLHVSSKLYLKSITYYAIKTRRLKKYTIITILRKYIKFSHF